MRVTRDQLLYALALVSIAVVYVITAAAVVAAVGALFHLGWKLAS